MTGFVSDRKPVFQKQIWKRRTCRSKPHQETAEGMNMVYYNSEELVIRNMEESDGPVFVEEYSA